MSQAIEAFLDRVMTFANRRPEEAEPIRAELRDHLAEKVRRLKDDGVEPEDAVFQAIEQMGNARTIGYGMRPRFPLIDIRSKGTARGFIAIGQRAVGVFAFGGIAVGVFAVGGIPVGIFSFGGLGLGLLFAWAGVAVAPLGLAYGGFAIGLLALGGFAAGVVAVGGAAVGVWVPYAGVAAAIHAVGTTPTFWPRVWRYMSDPQMAGAMSGIMFLVFLPLMLLGSIAMGIEERRTRKTKSVFAE